MDLAVASWNIGGGIAGASHQKGVMPNLQPYVEVLSTIDADVVCLQECQAWGRDRVQVADLADAIGYQYFDYMVLSKSHFDESADLGLGILSRVPLLDVRLQMFVNPGLEAVGPTGEYWQIADKGYLVCRLSHGDREFSVLNCHFFPLHYFRADPRERRFAPLWEDFRAELRALSVSAPIGALDLNTEFVDELLGATLAESGYRELTGRGPTTPKGVQQDYLVSGPGWTVREAGVLPTIADHHLLWAKLTLT